MPALVNSQQVSYMPTYAWRGADITPAATPTDVVTISGKAGKVIRVTHISITGSATASAIVDLYLTKRTTANTGGTSTTPAITKYDSVDPDPQAVIRLYSANPSSLGTGTALEGDMIYIPAAAGSGGAPTHWNTEYGQAGAKCPVLRSDTESISINLAGATLPTGAKFYFYIEWTESDI